MKLPVLLVCEDNGFAVHIPEEKRHGYSNISQIIEGFDCTVIQESSTDVEVIYNLTKQAIQEIQQKQKPVFLHLKYYRYLEHVCVFEDFKTGYHSTEEKEKWLKVDSVKLQRQKLLNWFQEGEFLTIGEKISNKILQSILLAEEAPFTEPNEPFERIYA